MINKPRVLIIGAGAVGALYGGRLSLSGAQVSVVARSDYDKVSTDGYSIKSVWGDFNFKPAGVYKNAQDAGADWNYIIVALKALPEINTAGIIMPALGPDTGVLLLQNGLGGEEALESALPGIRIMGGLAFVCVSRTGPGEIYHQDYGGLILGSHGGKASAECHALGALFNEAGVSCTVTDDLRAARWKKLCWNVPFNPMTVLSGGADTSALCADPESLAAVRAVMREVQDVSRADGHGFPDEHIEKQIRDTAVMKPYKPSMLLDYEAARPMEVEAILGNPVRRARELGVEVPRMETLYGLLRLADTRRARVK